MLDFLVVWSRAGVRDVKASEVRIRQEVERLRISPTHSFWAWYCPDGQMAVLVWASAVQPLEPASRVRVDDDGLELFIGWMLDGEGSATISHVSEARLTATQSQVGEYAALYAKNSGELRAWRNLMAPVPLYAAVEDGCFVLSTRASIAAYGRTLSTRFELDSTFARSVLSASISLNSSSLFEGVESVEQAVTVFRPPRGRPVLHRQTQDALHDESLSALYVADRKKYWDNAYEELLSLMPVVDSGRLPLVVPLSGGKDSRLLLGLLTASGRGERIEQIVTWGIAGSPEIQSATQVSDALGLSGRHDVRAGDGTVPAASRRDKFFRHAFVTEGEMSPLDLTGKPPVRAKLQLHGQEGGLRNIAGKRHFDSSQELLHWFKVHLGEWDVCKVLTDSARQENEDEFMDYFGRQLLIVDELNQIPSKHRVEHRFRRWVARTWHVYNASSFAPYLLASDAAVKATYNSGARSRSLEEFHFEMLRRADPQLVEIPFAGQSWDPDLTQLVERHVPTPDPCRWTSTIPVLNRRPIASALQTCLEDIKTILLSRRPRVLEGVVDFERLLAFDGASLKSGHVQPLLHLMNFLVADAVSAFADLDTAATEIGSFAVPDFDRT